MIGRALCGGAIGVLSLAVLAGCTLPSRVSSEVVPGESVPRLQSVYVYSFLAVREPELGRRFIDDSERLLQQALERANVLVQQKWPGRMSQAPVKAAFTTDTRHVPVTETITANREQEQAFGAAYRLVIVPQAYQRDGYVLSLEIRCDLVDAKTNRAVWILHGRTAYMINSKADDAADERAQQFVNALIGEMKKAGMLGT
jgi:hypothetical protein